MQPKHALARAISGSRRAFWVVGVFSLGINLLMLTVPIYMMQMFDRVVPSRNFDTLMWLSLIAVIALAVMAALEGIRGRLMVRLARWFDHELSGPVLAGTFGDSLKAGGLRGAQPLRDLASIRSMLTGGGLFPLFDAPWVPVFVAIIFLLHWHLGVIAVVGGVIVFGCAMLNDLMTRDALKEANAIGMRSLYRADAVVRNADVVAAMGMMPDLIGRWSQSNESGLVKQVEAGDRASLITSSAKLVRMLVQVGMLGYGAWLVTMHELTGGGMIAASIILGRAMAPVEQSIGAWRGVVAARNAFRNICALLERTPPVGEGMTLPTPAGRLSVEGVSFVPAGSREPVLRGISFKLDAGETLGVVGASAAGKTTLSRLLVGSWTPTAGHVRLDGADVAVWEGADRGRHVGYLPQDVELFEGTVRENIARMQEASDDDVVAAAELAGVHEMILRLPAGYDTQIGDDGVRLSGGQRQRVALARAAFGSPRLVVLDEPNSNLDTDGEVALANAIRRMKAEGTTIVIVAHRPSVLAQVDKLLVLRQGMVEAFGPRDEVMAKIAPGLRPGPRSAPHPSLVVTAGNPSGGRPA